MDNKSPIKITMRGNAGEVIMEIPCHVIDYNVAKEVTERGIAAVNLAISAYKAMEIK